MIIYNNISYDLIIPLGEECYTCASIDKKFSKNDIRKEAHPFDYVGYSYIENILEKIRNESSISDVIVNTNEYKDISTTVSPLYYWHEKTFNDDFKNNIFIPTYNRRYNRLYDNLKSKTILFFTIQHFDLIYNSIYNKHNLLNELYDTLSKYNSKHHLLAINYDSFSFTGKYEHICFDIDRSNGFELSKANFTNTIFDFAKNKFICT